MSGFHVDPAGLDGLYNALHRASFDVEQIARYAAQNCALTFEQQGLIANLAGPHHTAYQRMTEALGQVQRLSQGAATQVNLAQREYARSDTSAATRLDRTYPGAGDPAGLRGMLATGRPDLWPTPRRPPFDDVAEPTKHLVPPNFASAVEMWSINPMTDLASPAAWLRQVSVWLFDHDPFESWTEQLSGDWQSYAYCAVAWRIIGNAIHDVGGISSPPQRTCPKSGAGTPPRLNRNSSWDSARPRWPCTRSATSTVTSTQRRPRRSKNSSRWSAV